MMTADVVFVEERASTLISENDCRCLGFPSQREFLPVASVTISLYNGGTEPRRVAFLHPPAMDGRTGTGTQAGGGGGGRRVCRHCAPVGVGVWLHLVLPSVAEGADRTKNAAPRSWRSAGAQVGSRREGAFTFTSANHVGVGPADLFLGRSGRLTAGTRVSSSWWRDGRPGGAHSIGHQG